LDEVEPRRKIALVEMLINPLDQIGVSISRCLKIKESSDKSALSKFLATHEKEEINCINKKKYRKKNNFQIYRVSEVLPSARLNLLKN
jgi:hypothetical protein